MTKSPFMPVDRGDHVIVPAALPFKSEGKDALGIVDVPIPKVKPEDAPIAIRWNETLRFVAPRFHQGVPDGQYVNEHEVNRIYRVHDGRLWSPLMQWNMEEYRALGIENLRERRLMQGENGQWLPQVDYHQHSRLLTHYTQTGMITGNHLLDPDFQNKRSFNRLAQGIVGRPPQLIVVGDVVHAPSFGPAVACNRGSFKFAHSEKTSSLFVTQTGTPQEIFERIDRVNGGHVRINGEIPEVLIETGYRGGELDRLAEEACISVLKTSARLDPDVFSPQGLEAMGVLRDMLYDRYQLQDRRMTMPVCNRLEAAVRNKDDFLDCELVKDPLEAVANEMKTHMVPAYRVMVDLALDRLTQNTLSPEDDLALGAVAL